MKRVLFDGKKKRGRGREIVVARAYGIFVKQMGNTSYIGRLLTVAVVNVIGYYQFDFFHFSFSFLELSLKFIVHKHDKMYH